MSVSLDEPRASKKENQRRQRRAGATIVAAGLALALCLLTTEPATADAVTDRFTVGQWPTSIAVNPVTDTAYVASYSGVHSVGAGGAKAIYSNPADHVVVNSTTNKIYVSASGSIAVIDGATLAVTEIPVDSVAGVLAVNEKTNQIYVSTDNGLVILDGVTNAAKPVPGSDSAQDIIVNTATNKAYALSGGTIKVIDGSGKITSTVSIGADGFLAVAVNPTKNKIYATSAPKYGSSLKVIDGASNAIQGSIASSGPLGTLAVNAVTDKIYVGSGDSSSVSVKVMDGGTLTQTATIPTASQVRNIVVNPSNNKIYATMLVRGVTVIEGGNNRGSVVYTGWDPGQAAVNPNNNKVYVVNTASSGNQYRQYSVAVIDGDAARSVKNDFNGDGKTDILARDTAGLLWLYPGNGSGGWLPRVQVGQGWNVMTSLVAPGDFDDDGNADVLARDGAGLLWFYPGNGNGGWRPRVQVGHGWEEMNAVEGVDFYGDGFIDLIARNRSGNLYQYVADGKARFLHPAWAGSGFTSAAGLSEITGTDDFNSDGLGDLIARDGTGALWLYPASGYGSWLPKRQIGQGWNSMNSLVGPGDFNGDGKADILARNAAGELWLYAGSGGAAWPTATKVGTGWNGMTAIL
ncbi:DNA-binding beta-propeller fold protein YncE [Paenarthrobacter nicotinovorans]|uniref:FG-GAP-like repeat-containing protein n=1 Tax=Micrococcaceae TaxID=1268 RepID=UPI001587A2AE|nr:MULTISPECIES: FG-GAP-like repeat-containing protein [Micrococcaceae]MDR6435347.1 DNA-binding beta-propeller fold protein YncE [Paenarthrobacter nicotinovorans]